MRPRILIAALSFSAAGLVGTAVYENYTGTAVIPTKGDRPTVGFGSTVREDGSPVEMGDTIDPVRALKRTAAHIAKDESGLKRCAEGIELNQVEYDLLVDFAYQYGVPTACRSSIVRRYQMGEHEAACLAYTYYRFAGGYDCSIPGNRVCAGVWKRSLKRQTDCLAAQ